MDVSLKTSHILFHTWNHVCFSKGTVRDMLNGLFWTMFWSDVMVMLLLLITMFYLPKLSANQQVYRLQERLTWAQVPSGNLMHTLFHTQKILMSAFFCKTIIQNTLKNKNQNYHPRRINVYKACYSSHSDLIRSS